MVTACTSPEPPSEPPLSIDTFLEGDTVQSGFKKALHPGVLEFPRDHGAHPGFRNEWWYLTGNLADSDNRRFGFQFTVFRNALTPYAAENPSKWATNQIYLAHLAVTDAAGNRYYSDERFARGALGLAGATSAPFKVWLGDWQVQAEPGCPACFNLRLTASSQAFRLDLALHNRKSMVLHGDAGLSAKSNTPGNASYYYSYPRLGVRGVVGIDGRDYMVEGDSWFDHEWSTSYLERDQVGWDWFSVQLSDQTELMLFLLRHREDANKDFVYGTHIDAQGTSTQLDRSGFVIEALSNWSSPSSAVVYPSGWTITVVDYGLTLELLPLTNAQELNHSFRYWEGAVQARGSRHDEEVTGYGYVELTGYQ